MSYTMYSEGNGESVITFTISSIVHGVSITIVNSYAEKNL